MIVDYTRQTIYALQEEVSNVHSKILLLFKFICMSGGPRVHLECHETTSLESDY